MGNHGTGVHCPSTFIFRDAFSPPANCSDASGAAGATGTSAATPARPSSACAPPVPSLIPARPSSAFVAPVPLFTASKELAAAGASSFPSIFAKGSGWPFAGGFPFAGLSVAGAVFALFTFSEGSGRMPAPKCPCQTKGVVVSESAVSTTSPEPYTLSMSNEGCCCLSAVSTTSPKP